MTTATAHVETQLRLAPPNLDQNPIMAMAQAASASGDIEMFERIEAMFTREQDREAKRAFNVAFAAAQSNMPVIPKRGKGHVSDYALWEDINERIKKALHPEGLSLSFTSSFETSGQVLITAELRHRDGHSISGQFVAPIESGKATNGAQARGSAMTYGKRYATINILNLTTHGEDDDAFATGITDDAAHHLDAINAAKTLDELTKVKTDITRDTKLSGDDRKAVESDFKARWFAVNKGADNA